jgi:hypothetical protein
MTVTGRRSTPSTSQSMKNQQIIVPTTTLRSDRMMRQRSSSR